MTLLRGLNMCEDDFYDDGDDDDFDYEEFVNEEFPDDGVSHAMTNKNTKPIWRLVAVILLALSLFGFLLL